MGTAVLDSRQAHAGMIMSQAESKQSAGRSVRRIIPEAKRMGTAVLDSRQEHAGMTVKMYFT